jgi:hypothetical protein
MQNTNRSWNKVFLTIWCFPSLSPASAAVVNYKKLSIFLQYKLNFIIYLHRSFRHFTKYEVEKVSL